MAEQNRPVLIVEDKYDGHYLYYVRLLALEALRRGRRVVLATAPDLPTAPEGAFYLHDLLDRITIVELTDRSPAAVEALAGSLHAARTVVPDADLWLAPLAHRGGWRGPGRLELLVLRSSTQPRTVPGLQAARTAIKRLLMIRIAAMPRVRLTVLRSSIWRGRSLLPVTRDPITLSSSAAAVAAFADRERIDADRTWFAVLGNITDRKNLPLVAEAVARVAERAPVGFLVAGKVEPDEFASARPALERIEAKGALRVVDRMLDEDELDAAVALVDCLVLAHSNEGPSGLLAKAAATGTLVLTAGARSLRADARRIPTIAAWTPLDLERVSAALATVPGRRRPAPVVRTGTGAFTGSLLGPDAGADTRVVWCSPSYGYGGDLAYFEPIFRRLADRFPAMTVPVLDTFPVERYPGLPLRPILRLTGSYSAYGTGGRLIPTVGSLLRLARLRPTVLLAIEFTPLAVLGMLLTRLLPGHRRVLLLLESDPAYRGASGSAWVTRGKRLLASLADLVVANSDLALRFALEDLRLPVGRVVRATYLTSEPVPAGRATTGGAKPRSILFANSLVPRKGAAQLLRAFAELPDAAKAAGRLDVVGDGEERQRLEDLARRLGIGDRVAFHGRVPYRELHRYYGRADIVVAPSLADYRSLGAIEAAAAGLPAIVSVHDGAHPELARSGAIVVDPSDTAAFSAALATLLTDDKEYAARLALAQAHRDEHSVARVVDDITALILDRPRP